MQSGLAAAAEVFDDDEDETLTKEEKKRLQKFEKKKKERVVARNNNYAKQDVRNEGRFNESVAVCYKCQKVSFGKSKLLKYLKYYICRLDTSQGTATARR